MLRLLCLALVFIGGLAHAAPRRVAVLTLKNSARVTAAEISYITDRVRAGLLSLPSSQFVVLTRENILALLPPGTNLADCEGDCEVDTGRNIGADLVITGDVLRFGAGLRVVLRVHDVATARLIQTHTASGATVEGLEGPVGETARTLAGRLPAGPVRVTTSPRTRPPPAAPNRFIPDDTGFLVITSRPTGARVSIDGVPVGVTPQQHELTRGDHRVEVSHPLHHPIRRTVRISQASARLAVTLPVAHGELRVDGAPKGAQVRLNGEPVGRLPWSAPRKASGDYLLTVESPCHAPSEQRITIRDGQITRVRPVLQPICGALEITSDPPGAAIVLDDRPTGEVTPHVFTDRQPGTVRVRLEMPGHGHHDGRARIAPRLTRQHTATLTPQFGLLSVMAANADGKPCEGPLRIDGAEVGRTPWKGRVAARTVELTVRCASGLAIGRARVQHNEKAQVRVTVGQGVGGPDQCEARLAACLEKVGTDERAYRACFQQADICAGRRPVTVNRRSAAYVWQHADSPRSRARKRRGLRWSWMPQVDRLRDFHLLQGVIWLNERTDRLRMGLAFSLLNLHLANTTPDGFAQYGISVGTQLLGRVRIAGRFGMMGSIGIDGGWVPCDNGTDDSDRTQQERANHALCLAAVGDDDLGGEPDIGFAAVTTRVLADVDLGPIGAQAGWVRAQYFGGDDLVGFGGSNGFTLGMTYDF